MEATEFLIETKIGPNSIVDESTGFRTYFSVPIARTGILLYGASERPEVRPGPDGLIRIERLAEDVFEPASLQSLQGKPFVNEHHPVVDKANWKDVAAGTVINPRRGEGIFDDCIVADIVVNDAETIKDIDGGKREVSADYNPEYYDLGGGRGRQRKIRFNNVALVESGRCGPRCSIQDHAMKGETTMTATNKGRPWLDKLRALAGSVTQDKKASFDEAVEEAEKETKDNEGELTEPGKRDRTTADGEMSKRMDELEAKHATHDSRMKTCDAKLEEHEGRIKELEGKKEGTEDEDEDKEIEGELKEEAPPGTDDRAAKSKDSAFLVTSWQHTKSLAEIIAPGIQIPTFDSSGDPRVTYRGICDFRRKALSLGLLNAETNHVIEQVRAGRTLDSYELSKMKCGDIRTLFFATGTARKAANTSDSRGVGHFTNNGGSGGGLGVVTTPADINKRNAERYSGVETK